MKGRVVLLSAVVLVGVLVRALAARRGWLWYDEYYSAVFATFPHLDEVLRAVREIDFHPPLYYLQLRLWAKAGDSEVWLLGNSLLWSFVALGGVYVSANELSGRASALSSLAIFALAPFAVKEASELRMYAMLMGLAAWSTFFTVAQFTRPSPWRWSILAALFGSAIAWCHGAGILWFACSGLMAIPLLCQKRTNWRVRAAFSLSTAAAVAMSATPLLNALGRRPGHLQASSAADWQQIVESLFPGLSFVAIAIVLLAAVSSWRFSVAGSLPTPQMLVPVLGVFGTLGILWLIGQKTPIVHLRAVSFLLPVSCVAIGNALAFLIAHPSTRVRFVSACVMGLLCITSAVDLMPQLTRPERSRANHDLAPSVVKRNQGSAIWAPRIGTAYSLCWELRKQASFVSLVGKVVCTYERKDERIRIHSGSRRDQKLTAPFLLVLKTKERSPRIFSGEKLGKWKKLPGHRLAEVRARKRPSTKKR